MMPKYIIMYDADVQYIRQIEVNFGTASSIFSQIKGQSKLEQPIVQIFDKGLIKLADLQPQKSDLSVARTFVIYDPFRITPSQGEGRGYHTLLRLANQCPGGGGGRGNVNYACAPQAQPNQTSIYVCHQ
jgi:hypothetical protein